MKISFLNKFLAIVQDEISSSNVNYAIMGLIILLFGLITFTLLKNNIKNK